MFSAIPMIFRVLFVAALLLIPSVMRAKPATDDAGFAPKLTIYLARALRTRAVLVVIAGLPLKARSIKTLPRASAVSCGM
jgi:hypothetical protein